MLLESEDLLFKKGGVSRVRLLAKADSAATHMLDQGVAKILVDIMDESSDPGGVLWVCAR